MPTVIKCIVPDKRVVDVLRALKAYAIDPPVVEPMDDGPDSPARKAMAPLGSVSKVIFDYVAKAAKDGKKIVTTGELKAACKAAGANSSSYSYGLNKLVVQKKLRKSKLPASYEVVK